MRTKLSRSETPAEAATSTLAVPALKRIAKSRGVAYTNRALLFILPALILVIGLTYGGLGYTAFISTLDWNGIDADQQGVGIANYMRAFNDPIFWTALRNIALYSVVTIALQMGIGLAMAILLASGVRGRNVYKVIMVLPLVLGSAAMAVAFRVMLSPNGAFNSTLEFLGLGALTQLWIADPTFALWSIMAVSIWKSTGFSFILYQAALSQIEPDVLEAAQVDGAGPLRIIWNVVLPQLRGTHFVLLLLGGIGALNTFDIVLLITGGGPARTTEFLSTYIYDQTVRQYDAGYASALTIVLLVLALALTAIQMRLRRLGDK